MAKNGRSPDAPPPAFQFYPGDFLSDENVAAMTLEERGAYITLLCIAWREGSIPSNVEQIGRLLHIDGSAMQELWLAIGKCWENIENGRLKQPRMERERAYMQARSDERSRSGAKGAAKRWASSGSAMQQPLANDSTTTSTTTYKPPKAPQGGRAPWRPKNDKTDDLCQYLDRAMRWRHGEALQNKPSAARGRKAMDRLLCSSVSPEKATDVISHIWGAQSEHPSDCDYRPREGATFDWRDVVVSAALFVKHWDKLHASYAKAVNGRAVA